MWVLPHDRCSTVTRGLLLNYRCRSSTTAVQVILNDRCSTALGRRMLSCGHWTMCRARSLLLCRCCYTTFILQSLGWRDCKIKLLHQSVLHSMCELETTFTGLFFPLRGGNTFAPGVRDGHYIATATLRLFLLWTSIS